jgi:hypothetical protein
MNTYVQKHVIVRLENLEGWIEVRRDVCNNNITVHWHSGACHGLNAMYHNTAPIIRNKAGDDQVRELVKRAVMPEAVEELTANLMRIIASLRLVDNPLRRW